jgi:hypothetical protein
MWLTYVVIFASRFITNRQNGYKAEIKKLLKMAISQPNALASEAKYSIKCFMCPFEVSKILF